MIILLYTARAGGDGEGGLKARGPWLPPSLEAGGRPPQRILDLRRSAFDLQGTACRAPAVILSTPRPSPLAPRPSPALFPNPVGRVLRVALPPASGYLKFIDIAGRAVKCYPFGDGRTRLVIDVAGAGLGPGVYLARFETLTGTSQLKFVVAR